MKVKICVVITALFILSIFNSVFAGSDMKLEKQIEGQSLSNAKENFDIQKVIEKSSVKSIFIENKDKYGNPDLAALNGEDELIYGTPYKVVVANKEMVDNILGEKRLSGILPNLPYYWEVPVLLKNNPEKAVGSFIVDYFNGQWNIAEIGGYLSGEDAALCGNKDKVADTLGENNITEAAAFTHIRIPSLKSDYLYVDTAGQEYFIKLNGKGLSNKEKHFKESKKDLLIKHGDILKKGLSVKDNKIGGPAEEKSGASAGIPAVAAIACLSVIAAFTVRVSRKRNSKAV